MIRSFLDMIFPPHCLSCGERCRTRAFCQECWWLCELPDPATRCRHCFEELDQRGTLCAQCRRAPRLNAIRGYVFDPESPARRLGLDAVDAMASFAFYQWLQLGWDLPAGLIPMPDPHSIALGKAFAALTELPLIRAFRFDATYQEERLEEDQVWLVIDVANSLPLLKKATEALRESFPKRIYVVSLFPYVDCLH